MINAYYEPIDGCFIRRKASRTNLIYCVGGTEQKAHTSVKVCRIADDRYRMVEKKKRLKTVIRLGHRTPFEICSEFPMNFMRWCHMS